LFVLANAYDVDELTTLILDSKAYPSINGTNGAYVLARLLMKEEAEFSSNCYQAGSEPAPFAFPCTLVPRSSPRPTNARRLKAADFDVVATIGDSVAAGFGALATSIFTVFTEYRGYSFPVGGEVVYDKFNTVANVLKLYNPNIKGFAVGNGGQTSANAVLNSAVSGARSYDLPGQVDYLEARMRSLGVNFDTDWKILSIFIGGNDLCDYCSDTTKNSPSNFRNNLEVTLDIIKGKFPKVFVNLISPPDVTLLGQVTGGACSLLHAFECGCATDVPGTKIAHAEYVKRLNELVLLPKYQDKEDFYVTFQPFLSNFTLPMINGSPDRSYFAPDCFHFSGKAHQAAAVALWNNMCEPFGKKSDYWVPGEPIECPVEFLA